MKKEKLTLFGLVAPMVRVINAILSNPDSSATELEDLLYDESDTVEMLYVLIRGLE